MGSERRSLRRKGVLGAHCVHEQFQTRHDQIRVRMSTFSGPEVLEPLRYLGETRVKVKAFYPYFYVR